MYSPGSVIAIESFKASRSDDAYVRAAGKIVGLASRLVGSKLTMLLVAGRDGRPSRERPLVYRVNSPDLDFGRMIDAYPDFADSDPFLGVDSAPGSLPVISPRDLGGHETFARSAFASGFLAEFGIGSRHLVHLRYLGRLIGLLVFDRRDAEESLAIAEKAQLLTALPVLSELMGASLRNDGFVAGPTVDMGSLSKLSDREREVAELVVRGRSAVEIAHALQLSPGTVRSHMRKIFVKLQIGSRIELVALALGGEPGVPEGEVA